jgi:hypothetical protein
MSDVENVATNTGLTVSEVTTMKKHLFFGKHQRFAPEVGGVVRKRFDANDDIAEAWLKAHNVSLDARQQQWFRQLRDHELGERSLMGKGVPFQDVSAWHRINGQWEHVYREGLRGRLLGTHHFAVYSSSSRKQKGNSIMTLLAWSGTERGISFSVRP